MKASGENKPTDTFVAPEASDQTAVDSDAPIQLLREGLSPRAIRLSAILWPSFMVAGVATMLFFAFVDPHELNLISFPKIDFSRELGYSLGFFLLWLNTASASYLTALLLGPGRAP